MKLLTICPSCNRPELCKRMLDSFDATKTEDTDIVVYVAIDDPQIGKYEDLLNGRLHIFAPRRSLVKALNYVSCGEYPDVSYYQEVNDDHIYRTPGWDKVLIDTIEKQGNGWGISFGNDLMTNEPWEVARHPSAAVISGNIVRVLKCFVLPTLDHLFTDTYLRDIGEGIGAYYRHKDIIIEHCHFISNKARMDDNYRYIYSQLSYRQARKKYYTWFRHDKRFDIQKIAEARKSCGNMSRQKITKFPFSQQTKSL